MEIFRKVRNSCGAIALIQCYIDNVHFEELIKQDTPVSEHIRQLLETIRKYQGYQTHYYTFFERR